MKITITELRKNLNRYLKLSTKEDVYVTKNGRIVSVLTNPLKEKIKTAESLFGVIKSDIDPEEVRKERLDKI